MHINVDKFMDGIVEQIKKQGIGDFMVAFRNPDRNEDVSIYEGSIFWRAGLGLEITEKATEAMRMDREANREADNA